MTEKSFENIDWFCFFSAKKGKAEENKKRGGHRAENPEVDKLAASLSNQISKGFEKKTKKSESRVKECKDEAIQRSTSRVRI